MFYCNLVQLAEAIKYTDCIFVGGKTLFNVCLEYDAKTSDAEVPVRELWAVLSTHLFLLLPSLPKLGAVVPARVSSMGQIELINHLTMLETI